ncbi:MAG: nickel-responsive transcriptional regulator NikR [Candidatus Asgardarchaeia archaeon]
MNDNERMERISVTLPASLIRRMESFIKKSNYPSRSKMVQDAIRDFLVKHDVSTDVSRNAIGALLVVFEHYPHNVETEITHIQHHFGPLVRSTLHIHLDESRCFEIISLNGSVGEMKKLTLEIQKVKGVLSAELFIMEEL